MSWKGPWYGATSGGVIGGSAIVLSTSPSSFDGLDAEAARWTPIVFLVQIRSGESLFVLYKKDNDLIPQVVFDADDGFSPLFEGKSGVVQQADPTQFLVTLLPNGGWFSANFTVKFLSATELSE